jgi:hypothetical protein
MSSILSAFLASAISAPTKLFYAEAQSYFIKQRRPVLDSVYPELRRRGTLLY